MTDEFELGKEWIRGAVFSPGEGNFKIELAETTQIDAHREWVDLLLGFIGHPEALVTDRSTLRDFMPDGVTMRILGNTFKRILNVDETIWELAKELEGLRDPS